MKKPRDGCARPLGQAARGLRPRGGRGLRGEVVEGGGVIAASVQLQPLRPKVQVSHCRHFHVSDQVEWSDLASIPFLAGWQLGSGVLG